MVHVVIPAFNERENIGRLLADLAPTARRLGARVVVVDDGSTDGTAAAALARADGLPLTVVNHPENRGLGAAVRTGLGRVLDEAGDEDAIVTLEGDHTWDLADLSVMLDHFRAGADLVMASYFAPGGRLVGVTTWRALGSRAISGAFRTVGSLKQFHQVTPLYRVYRAGVLRRVQARYGDGFIEEDGFAVNVELLLKMLEADGRVVEVPTTLDWSHRQGDSKLRVASTLAGYARLLARQRRYRRSDSGARPSEGSATASAASELEQPTPQRR